MALDPITGFTQIEQAVANHALQANNAMGDLAQAAAGYLAKSVAVGGTISLSLDESQYAVIDLTGAPGSNVTVVQHASAPKVTLYRNLTTGTAKVFVKQDGGTAFRVPRGGSVTLLDGDDAHTDDGTSTDRIRFFEDFASAPRFTSFVLPVFNDNDDAAYVDVNNGDIARCLYRSTRSSKLIGVAIFAESGLATSNTDYVTFTLTNKVNGAQTVVMLAVTDANTTKTTGGSAIAAYTTRSLTLSATALDLAVNAGDVLLFEVTTTAATALANPVRGLHVRLQFEELPESVAPLGQRTTRSVLYEAVTAEAGGGFKVQLPAPAETLAGRIDSGGRLLFNADFGPVFRCRAKISGVAADQDYFFGLSGAAAGVPYDNTLINAWLRVAGNSFNLVAEVDNNAGNDDDDNPTGVTLVADTYFIGEVDLSDLANVRFRHNGATVATLSLSGLAANTLLQFLVATTKTAGAQTDSFTLEWIEVIVWRD